MRLDRVKRLMRRGGKHAKRLARRLITLIGNCFNKAVLDQETLAFELIQFNSISHS